MVIAFTSLSNKNPQPAGWLMTTKDSLEVRINGHRLNLLIGGKRGLMVSKRSAVIPHWENHNRACSSNTAQRRSYEET
jgi:hypothetical protein